MRVVTAPLESPIVLPIQSRESESGYWREKKRDSNFRIFDRHSHANTFNDARQPSLLLESVSYESANERKRVQAGDFSFRKGNESLDTL